MKKVLVMRLRRGLAMLAIAIAATPVKGPLFAPAPAYTWNGLYVGVHVGHAWANRSGCFDFASTTVNCVNDFDDTFNYQQSGWLAGAQAGYNWMFSPNWLVGVEVDAIGREYQRHARLYPRLWRERRRRGHLEYAGDCNSENRLG